MSKSGKHLALQVRPYLSMVEVPFTGGDVHCDKCNHVIVKGIMYLMFTYVDHFGHAHSARCHKLCLDLVPELELH